MPLTPIEALLDVNVIIASIFADHVMHGPARGLVEALERFYTTPALRKEGSRVWPLGLRFCQEEIG